MATKLFIQGEKQIYSMRDIVSPANSLSEKQQKICLALIICNSVAAF